MWSPCIGCSRISEDKEICSKNCKRIKEYQHSHNEKSKIEAIDYAIDYYQIMIERENLLKEKIYDSVKIFI